MKRSDCRLCHSRSLSSVVDLGSMPHAGNFPLYEQVKDEPSYPLELFVCDDCHSVQLLDVIPKEDLFSDYRYLSSTTNTLRNHLQSLASTISRVRKPGRVLEIGCNDGVLLKPLSDLGWETLGVDPARNVVATADADLEIINDFFTEDLSKKIWEEHGVFDVIVGTNVFAHIDDMDTVMRGIDVLLAPTGVLVMEVHYLLDIIRGMQYDSIYHEHFQYHSIKPLQRFLRNYGLRIIQVEKVPIHGGSLRVLAVRGTSDHGFLGEGLLREEEELISYDKILEWGRSVVAHKESLVRALRDIKDSGARIVGYGAPGRGNTLLNYCGIGPDVLEFTVDESPERAGRFTPGSHVPILPVDSFRDPYPDYALVLAWTYREEIIAKEKEFIDSGGKFIFPLPSMEIVG